MLSKRKVAEAELPGAVEHVLESSLLLSGGCMAATGGGDSPITGIVLNISGLHGFMKAQTLALLRKKYPGRFDNFKTKFSKYNIRQLQLIGPATSPGKRPTVPTLIWVCDGEGASVVVKGALAWSLHATIAAQIAADAKAVLKETLTFELNHVPFVSAYGPAPAPVPVLVLQNTLSISVEDDEDDAVDMGGSESSSPVAGFGAGNNEDYVKYCQLRLGKGGSGEATSATGMREFWEEVYPEDYLYKEEGRVLYDSTIKDPTGQTRAPKVVSIRDFNIIEEDQGESDPFAVVVKKGREKSLHLAEMEIGRCVICDVDLVEQRIAFIGPNIGGKSSQKLACHYCALEFSIASKKILFKKWGGQTNFELAIGNMLPNVRKYKNGKQGYYVKQGDPGVVSCTVRTWEELAEWRAGKATYRLQHPLKVNRYLMQKPGTVDKRCPIVPSAVIEAKTNRKHVRGKLVISPIPLVSIDDEVAWLPVKQAADARV